MLAQRYNYDSEKNARGACLSNLLLDSIDRQAIWLLFASLQVVDPWESHYPSGLPSAPCQFGGVVASQSYQGDLRGEVVDIQTAALHLGPDNAMEAA
jgi:hypothetical protein